MGRSGASEIKAGAAYVEIDGDDAKLKGALRGAKAMMSRFAADISSMGKRMALAGAAALAPMVLAIKKAGDYQEILSKFKAVFKEHSGQAKQWSDSFAKSVGRARVDILSYMAAMQDTFVPLGFARDRAMELSKSITTLTIDLASFNNEADDEVLRRLQSALVGNHETVRKYGVLISQASLGQELLNMGVKDGIKNATNQQKVMARLNIIMKSTGDAQKDATRTAGSYANQVKRLRAGISNLLVTLGEHLIPTVTEWVKSVNKAIVRAEEWIKNNKQTIVTFIKLAATIAVVGVALLALGKTIGIVMFMLTPAGAIGAAVAGLFLLLDALGVVNVGFVDFLQNVRVGGHKISVWMSASWIEVFKSWEWLKEKLITGWEGIVLGVKMASIAVFRAFIWVPQKILEGFDNMITGVVDGLNWMIEQINKIPTVMVDKITSPKFAKDAVAFFRNMSEEGAATSAKAWDRFQEDRQARAKDTQMVLAALQRSQEKLFTGDIEGIRRVAGAAAIATAGAAAPAMPTAGGGAGGTGGAVFGTFAGRGAAGFAGGGGLQKEMLRIDKGMLQFLRAIAENTKNPTAVYG